MRKELESNFNQITLSDLKVNVHLYDVYGGNCSTSYDVDCYRETQKVATFCRNRIEYSDEIKFLDEMLEKFLRIYSLDSVSNSKETQVRMLLITLESIVRNM